MLAERGAAIAAAAAERGEGGEPWQRSRPDPAGRLPEALLRGAHGSDRRARSWLRATGSQSCRRGRGQVRRRSEGRAGAAAGREARRGDRPVLRLRRD